LFCCFCSCSPGSAPWRAHAPTRIRSGISCFADAPDQQEIARGLQQLADDIESGRIKEVISKFKYDGGDYMFTVAER